MPETWCVRVMQRDSDDDGMTFYGPFSSYDEAAQFSAKVSNNFDAAEIFQTHEIPANFTLEQPDLT